MKVADVRALCHAMSAVDAAWRGYEPSRVVAEQIARGARLAHALLPRLAELEAQLSAPAVAPVATPLAADDASTAGADPVLESA
jgi:hypothetical protein